VTVVANRTITNPLEAAIRRITRAREKKGRLGARGATGTQPPTPTTQAREHQRDQILPQARRIADYAGVHKALGCINRWALVHSSRKSVAIAIRRMIFYGEVGADLLSSTFSVFGASNRSR